MTNRYWLPITFLIAGFCFFCYSAEAQFPKPRPAAAPQATAAPVQAPPVQAAPVEVAAPVVNVSPQLVAPAPSWMDQIQSWLNTIFAGGIMGLLAKIGFRPAAPVTPVPGAGPSVVSDVLSNLNKPEVKQALAAHGLEIALAAAQNPLVNTATQAGLSFVPGLGAAEPIIRSLGIKALQDLVARNEAKAA